MARKRMFSHSEKKEICDYYLAGNSTLETGIKFNLSTGGVWNLLKREKIQIRSIAKGNSLKWENKEFRQNQVDKRIGKPSGALGKKWVFDRVIVRPNLKGELNHRWKGGKTKISFTVRNLPEYGFWRKAVFQRDRYTCQHCGAKNRKGEKYIFDADHIYPLCKLIDDFNIKSADDAKNCPEIWDIENGRCLCRGCHKKTDTWGNNLQKTA